jgi:TetR/AcrR family transcriptional regulator, transcriptional repressor for nem operon
MNRPRHFDLNDLRERVTDVFAEHGYRGTSMAMLLDASGLGKQSLYNALGDKEAAYLQSIECASVRNAALQAAVANAPDGRAAVHLFFAQGVEACTRTGAGQSACLMTTGMMEGIEAEAIAAKLEEKWHELCMLLLQSVKRGQKDGSIRRDVPAKALGNLLTTLVLGLRMTARTPTDRKSLQTTVQWVLKLLDVGSPVP